MREEYKGFTIVYDDYFSKWFITIKRRGSSIDSVNYLTTEGILVPTYDNGIDDWCDTKAQAMSAINKYHGIGMTPIIGGE